MRATVLPLASILIKAHRAAVSMMAKGCILDPHFLWVVTILILCFFSF